MSTVVVVVTVPTRTVTVLPTSPAHPSSNLSAGTIAGIVIGTLLGGILLIALLLYLLNRFNRHKFTRVANPPHVDAERAHLSSVSLQESKLLTRHSQRPSVSSEPLMSPTSWPPISTTSRVLSPARLDTMLPEIRYSSFTLGELHPGVASDTTIPPAHQASSASSQTGLGDTTPHTRQMSGDGAISPPTPTKSTQTLFLHRMLKSRAQASEGGNLAYRPSIGFSPGRSATLDSSDVHGDEERLLAEAERSALRDAEAARKGEEEMVEEEEEEEEMVEGEEDWVEVQSTESMYSQGSAPLDHPGFLSDPVSRQNSTSSMPRRKSSRRHPRAPTPAELSPVTEMPDTPRALEGQAVSRPAANVSLDARVSPGTADQSGGNFPLLTSTNFGKDSTLSAKSASCSSTAGFGSSSSGRTSRYPSLAPSSIGLSSHSGPRPDAGTDWHHPPSGLAGLTSLQIGPLQNPHSPVEERRGLSVVEPAPVKRAHLRDGTVSSLPEVERRDVMHGGIAGIDVAL